VAVDGETASNRADEPITIRIFDRWIVPVVRRVEDRVRTPFGQSIFLVARRVG